MRIAIDASAIIYETGVSVYTKHLIENLLKIDKKNDYLLFGGSFRRRKELLGILNNLADANENAISLVYPIPPTLGDIIWNQIRLTNIESFFGEMDVFHSSDWTQPPSSAYKVTTVHDLAPIKFPELSNSKIVSVHKRRLKLVKHEVDRIIAPSKATKADLVDYGVRKDKISVIYEAPDPNLRKSDSKEIEKVKDKYKIRGNYLISVGINPRKNTERIIKAYENLRENDLELVLIGENFSKIKVSAGVRVLGHVKRDEIAPLYSGALCLVYPSVYEGFGLPILEGFACSVPVVTSNVGSMKEVADDAAVLVDPENVSEITEGIKIAIGRKKEFISKGKKRLKNFSWRKTAKKTLEVYKRKK